MSLNSVLASLYAGFVSNAKVAAVLLGGTGGDNTKYLRGDQTWQLISSIPGSAHNLLSATHSDTTAGAAVKGDIVISTSAGVWGKLAASIVNNDVLTFDTGTGQPKWAAAPGGASFTAGMIMMWSGTIATIPAGWALCDGTGGTPDLRNRFIVCADADVGGVAKTTITGGATQSGGSISYTPAGSVAAPVFTGDALGNHNHTSPAVNDHGAWTHASGGAHTHNAHTASGKVGTGAATAFTLPLTHSSDGGHTHDEHAALVHTVAANTGNASAGTPTGSNSAPAFTGTAATIIPPYYALAYIMKT